MVGKENYDGIFRMWILIQVIQYPADFLIGLEDGGKVGINRNLSAVLLLHPYAEWDIGIFLIFIAGGIRNIGPFILVNY